MSHPGRTCRQQTQTYKHLDSKLRYLEQE